MSVRRCLICPSAEIVGAKCLSTDLAWTSLWLFVAGEVGVVTKSSQFVVVTTWNLDSGALTRGGGDRLVDISTPFSAKDALSRPE